MPLSTIHNLHSNEQSFLWTTLEVHPSTSRKKMSCAHVLMKKKEDKRDLLVQEKLTKEYSKNDAMTHWLVEQMIDKIIIF